MRYDFTLTGQQQSLVESNLSVIDKVISLYITVNEDVCGLGRDDLYQEGAIALCKAASTYDGVSAQFSTYATVVVRNYLFSYCKSVNTGHRHLSSVSMSSEDPSADRPPPFPEPSTPDAVDALIDALDAADFLEDYKKRYSGVARLGVEALELRIKGMNGADIARLYNTTPNNVGAWIARAVKKIRKEVADGVEKRLPNL